jgi:hypothetical protein
VRRGKRFECRLPDLLADVARVCREWLFLADSCLWCSGRPNDRSGSTSDSRDLPLPRLLLGVKQTKSAR